VRIWFFPSLVSRGVSLPQTKRTYQLPVAVELSNFSDFHQQLLVNSLASAPVRLRGLEHHKEF
jgi:hypothetical protein